jgi:hypothetical protein
MSKAAYEVETENSNNITKHKTIFGLKRILTSFNEQITYGSSKGAT